ncbi:DUF1295 domain-containing protein [Nakamurella silvestris]|nr:DUF1295 domain-containing protein [Nakamurella silvestris]
MGPVQIVLIVAGVACGLAWLLSLITHEHSWVDRLWSVLPVIYLWIFAGSAGLEDTRLNVMAVLVTLWGARLTFNFARKGGYSGTEDYRWAILRTKMKPWQFEVFNLVFIVLYQNALLVLICLPALTASQNPSAFGVGDFVLTILFLGFLLGETVADQQQWNFHRRKHAPGYTGKGFLTTGLWRYSRHPNFFFEQAQWWVIYAFGAVAAGSVFHWTIAGAALLTGLFLGSAAFTEWISQTKYPDYAVYQRTTSQMIPWVAKRRVPVSG